MRKKKTLIFALAILVACSASWLRADSIWAKRNKNMKDLYADDKARHIGDILTITVSEDSSINNKGKRNLSKKTDRSIDFDGDIDFNYERIDKLFSDPHLPSFDMSAESSNTFDTKTDYSDERLFEDSVTVTIIDIMPNRNLVVMGTRRRDIAGDEQVIEISGIVRPSDIGFNNTVDSDRVANFTIETKNSGISESFNKPGWFGRFLDIIWPF